MARTKRSTTSLGKRADGKNAEGRCSDHATRSHPSQHRREADSYVKNAKAVSRQGPQGKRTDAFPPRDRTAPKREPGSERRHIKTADAHERRQDGNSVGVAQQQSRLGEDSHVIYTPGTLTRSPARSDSTVRASKQQRLRTTREQDDEKCGERPARRRSHRKRDSWQC